MVPVNTSVKGIMEKTIDTTYENRYAIKATLNKYGLLFKFLEGRLIKYSAKRIVSTAKTKETAGEVYFKQIHSLKSIWMGIHIITVLFQSFNEKINIIMKIIQYSTI